MIYRAAKQGKKARSRVQRTGLKEHIRFLIWQVSYYHLPSFVLALLFQIPDWPNIFERIYGQPMVDRAVYETSLLDYNLSIDFLAHFNIVIFFSFEWVWNSFIAFLNRDIGLSPDQIFSLLTTFILWRFIYQIATSIGWLYVPLLVNPLIVTFAFSQLRSATAIAVLSFFWRGQRGTVSTILSYVAATAIHTSMILFAVMHLASHWFKEPRLLSLIALVLTGFAITFAIGPAREVILGAIGDRRAEYGDISSSLPYLSFWLLLFLMLLSRWKDTLVTIDGRYALIILSIVASSLFFSTYSTRFIAAAFPSIVIAMVSWRSKPIALPLILFMPYAFTQWMYWLRLI